MNMDFLAAIRASTTQLLYLSLNIQQKTGAEGVSKTGNYKDCFSAGTSFLEEFLILSGQS